MTSLDTERGYKMRKVDNTALVQRIDHLVEEETDSRMLHLANNFWRSMAKATIKARPVWSGVVWSIGRFGAY